MTRRARSRARADDRAGRHRLHRQRRFGGVPAMSVEILTFGCRLNAYESEVMRDLTSRAGPGEAGGLDDTIIVNTCAVTAEAERQARQAIRRANRARPGARIVVTGCAAQSKPQAWAGLPGVTRVLGNVEKLLAGELGARRAVGRRRHHDGAGDRGASGHRVRRPRPRLRPGAAGLRSSLHLLHHPVRPRPSRAACRWARWWRRCARWWRRGITRWC